MIQKATRNEKKKLSTQELNVVRRYSVRMEIQILSYTNKAIQAKKLSASSQGIGELFDLLKAKRT